MTHICVDELAIIYSDNGLSPGRGQAIIWTSAALLLIRPLGTNFNEILIGFQAFSFKKMHLKMSSAKWRPFCLGLNVSTLQPKNDQITMLYPWYLSPQTFVPNADLGLLLSNSFVVLLKRDMLRATTVWLWSVWWYGSHNGKHIEAETKWPPFRRRHFQTHLLEWKC